MRSVYVTVLMFVAMLPAFAQEVIMVPVAGGRFAITSGVTKRVEYAFDEKIIKAFHTSPVAQGYCPVYVKIATDDEDLRVRSVEGLSFGSYEEAEDEAIIKLGRMNEFSFDLKRGANSITFEFTMSGKSGKKHHPYCEVYVPVWVDMKKVLPVLFPESE